MSCCEAKARRVAEEAATAELVASVMRKEDGRAALIVAAPDISCGACIGRIERGLAEEPSVVEVRVNLTQRRVSLTLRAPEDAPAAVAALADLGYRVTPLDPEEGQAEDPELKHLIRAVAVAGFAAGNVMLLSVSVWSGADGATRDLFHLISALIAVPAAAFAGQTFFRSAIRAIRKGRLNMDVPISLAVILALGLSLERSLAGGEEAYFDAAVMLLFFLLIGRTLDRRMRVRARSAVTSLSRLAVRRATLVEEGVARSVPVEEVTVGMLLRVLPGARVPADGRIEAGTSDLDRALITGEAAPVPVGPGVEVEGGTLNLTGPIDLRVERPPSRSYLAEVQRMLAAAEVGRGGYVRIADRMARIYAPAVHLLALSAGLGWWLSGAGPLAAITTAIAVLIVTCPCALGLAVPVVHVVGAGRLFEAGILMRDGSALERLAEADHVIFDKTGTLSIGLDAHPPEGLSPRDAGPALVLALASSHPAAAAVARALSGTSVVAVEGLREVPGAGVEARVDGRWARLGRGDWVGEIAEPGPTPTGLAFACEGSPIHRFEVTERLRPGAAETIRDLNIQRIPSEILSGDSAPAVATIATALDIPGSADVRPEGKLARIEELKRGGRRVLMVGDGLNDAPALGAAHVSMAPAGAADVGRAAADFVFLRDSLVSVTEAMEVARRAQSLVRQNFGLALLYNAIAVPLAVAGLVTPLVAAIAMSASSIIVIANSLRLLVRHRRKRLPVPVALPEAQPA
ncbi:MAG: heavy metal translocating P-type ATPase [Pseudomonadota bacterium]